MTVAVLGAGAVGCWHAARLAEAGERVVLIGRPAAAQAIADSGIRLDEPSRAPRVVCMGATADPAAAGAADLVLVCVKSGDTEQAARDLAPHLAAAATVVSLQNGLDNAARIARITGRPALPGLVYTALALAGPGHVALSGGGRVVIGDGRGAAAAARRFRAAGIAAEVSADTDTALWTKLAVNCALNAVSALTGQTYGRIADHPEAMATLDAIVDECRATAAAEGVALPADLPAQVRAVMQSMPGQRSSTAQDLAAGRRTEIAWINGEIARRAGVHGVPAPLNRALALMISLREG